MPSQVSIANIGLTYLENAVLDTLTKSNYTPAQLARILGLNADVRGKERSAGKMITRAVLEALEQDQRVQRCSGYPTWGWELTERERLIRR